MRLFSVFLIVLLAQAFTVTTDVFASEIRAIGIQHSGNAIYVLVVSLNTENGVMRHPPTPSILSYKPDGSRNFDFNNGQPLTFDDANMNFSGQTVLLKAPTGDLLLFGQGIPKKGLGTTTRVTFNSSTFSESGVVKIYDSKSRYTSASVSSRGSDGLLAAAKVDSRNRIWLLTRSFDALSEQLSIHRLLADGTPDFAFANAGTIHCDFKNFLQWRKPTNIQIAFDNKDTPVFITPFYDSKKSPYVNVKIFEADFASAVLKPSFRHKRILFPKQKDIEARFFLETPPLQATIDRNFEYVYLLQRGLEARAYLSRYSITSDEFDATFSARTSLNHTYGLSRSIYGTLDIQPDGRIVTSGAAIDNYADLIVAVSDPSTGRTEETRIKDFFNSFGLPYSACNPFFDKRPKA